mmetsp:Transcript_27157/g.46821  ORF Transcript_27157/g.46821 Transcript_27157/m.46821 type:complete len:204 (-) Transcript_27157:819-1430(-)|eukprot:CAMPEP_0196651688 /NCGR_PEP_ID=MMETSP1086-20130531/740_1 /TAXON_ID=77921 /ORGANISM="Cyanoptyche  gloeocystis , Strain SAG4.97" /LENGTH=203 /DNA_ID=CAMNT_0041981821 /DNA_START=121 /DNA_END=732 /DNA_ORIENTATION=+
MAFVPAVAVPLTKSFLGQTSSICSQKKSFGVSNVSFSVRAEEEEAPKPKAKPAAVPFSVPTLNLSTPSPIFGGSTGGLLRKAEVEEFYAITWTGKSEAIFEMPSGGAAIMRAGENLLRLPRKEHCIALGKQLKDSFKITDYKIYRAYPSGEVQFLHPKDGVFPEKVNPGRAATNVNKGFKILGNPEPATVKFSGKPSYEAKSE